MQLPAIIEQNGQRVLTTAQLAEAYGTSKDTIRQNFKRNKSRYVEGKHFYCLAGEALKGFKGNVTNCHVVPKTIHQLTLWTERGALLHAKSLNTDKAWEVYDFLVENYFRKPLFDAVHSTPVEMPDHWKVKRNATLMAEYHNIQVEIAIKQAELSMSKQKEETFFYDHPELFAVLRKKEGGV